MYSPQVFTPQSLIATSDGGLAFAAQNVTRPWLVKTDAEGNLEWDKTFIADGIHWLISGANCLIETRDGGLLMTSYSNSASRAGEYFLVKVDAGLPPLPTLTPATNDEQMLIQNLTLVLLIVLIMVTAVLVVWWTKRETKNKA
jgi:hypothetical protein